MLNKIINRMGDIGLPLPLIIILSVVSFAGLSSILYSSITHSSQWGFFSNLVAPFYALSLNGIPRVAAILSVALSFLAMSASIFFYLGQVWRYLSFHIMTVLILLVLGSYASIWIFANLFDRNLSSSIQLMDLAFVFNPAVGGYFDSVVSAGIGFGILFFMYGSYVVNTMFGVGKTLSKARFGHGIDIYRAGLFSKTGFVLGKTIHGLLRYGGFEPILIISGTGGGKTKAVAIPNIYELTEENFVITDVKREIYDKTADYRRMIGDEVLKFEPGSKDTLRYNPFALVRPEFLQEDMDMIINTLIPESKDPLWGIVGRDITTMLALFLMSHRKMTPTLEYIYTIACSPTLKETLETSYADIKNPQLKNLCGKFLQYPDEFRGNAIVNTQAFLAPFCGGNLSNATSGNDFDFTQLRHKPMSIYLVVPANTETYNGICSIFFEQVVRLTTSTNEPAANERTINLVIDEFGNLPKMVSIDKGNSWLRSYRIRVIAFVQRLSQIEKLYGRESKDGFMASPVKVAFQVDSENDREFVSKLIGKTTVRVKNYSSGQNGHDSVSSQIQQKPLMSPDEVGRLSFKKLLIFVTGYQPIKARKNFYSSNRRYKSFYNTTRRRA